eukprot:TRINITY_DN5047_c0_g1_i1.p1 TRINITY_DN5047_c0_g1~~TRINITY_DN5047_c0_g1_i1.p1  ORF type:complete len:454 (+),score=74.38 TRINITY_DN5047_c0_g1_i1:2-1363(+)
MKSFLCCSRRVSAPLRPFQGYLSTQNLSRGETTTSTQSRRRHITKIEYQTQRIILENFVTSNQRRCYTDIKKEQMHIPPFPEQEEEILQVENKIHQFKQNVDQVTQTIDPVMRVTAFSNAAKYDLVSLQLSVVKIAKNTHPKTYHTKRGDTSFLHFKITEETGVSSEHPRSLAFLVWSGNDKDYYVFEDGVVVGWGIDEIDQHSIQQLIIVENPQPLLKEDIIFKFGSHARLDSKNDTIIITTKDEFLEKVACSFALARSVKLDAIEIEAEDALNQAKQLKFDSTTKVGKLEKGMSLINKPREQLARLHKLSYDLSVRARVMEAPIFLWDKPNSFTDIYTTTGKYFDFEARQHVVQKKLDLPLNYWTLENDHASSIMGWRLEKMIIILILIEVLFNILDKSEHWEYFSWEKAFYYVLGIPYTPKKKSKDNPLGDEYEVVSETYEIVETTNTTL